MYVSGQMTPEKLVAIACAAYESSLWGGGSDESDFVREATEGLLGPPDYVACDMYDVEAYVLKFPGHVVFAIRGTDSLVDLYQDSRACLTEWNAGSDDDGARVHRGFAAQFGAIREKLLQKHLEVVSMTPDVRITCTGHSSGAALACMLATTIGGAYVGFGAPKVGDEAFALLHREKCGDASAEYVNGSDVIPKLPLGGEYAHAASSQTHVGPSDSMTCVARMSGLSDHECVAYWRSMTGWGQQRQTTLQYLRDLWTRLFCACR
jgi:hypothetical protein